MSNILESFCLSSISNLLGKQRLSSISLLDDGQRGSLSIRVIFKLMLLVASEYFITLIHCEGFEPIFDNIHIFTSFRQVIPNRIIIKFSNTYRSTSVKTSRILQRIKLYTTSSVYFIFFKTHMQYRPSANFICACEMNCFVHLNA